MELESVTKDLSTKKSNLKLSITTLDRYAKILNIIQPIEHEIPVLENYEVTILLDPERVCGCLNSHQGGDGEDYLEPF